MIMMAMVIMMITVIVMIAVMVTVMTMIERRVMMALPMAFLLAGSVSFTVGILKVEVLSNMVTTSWSWVPFVSNEAGVGRDLPEGSRRARLLPIQ